MTTPQLFHCLRYTDADRGIDFLQAIGFTTAMIVRDPDDATLVAHAQLAWRDNGGIMLGSVRDDDPHYGPGICNLVVASDEDVDSLFAAALAHGATTVTEPNDATEGATHVSLTSIATGGTSTPTREPEPGNTPRHRHVPRLTSSCTSQ